MISRAILKSEIDKVIEIPEDQAAIPAAGDEQALSRVEGEPGDPSLVASQGRDRGTVRAAPEPDRPVLGRGPDQLAGRIEADERDHVLVAAQGMQLLSRERIPQQYGAVPRCGGKHAALIY